jgi:hypothetical protein
MAIWLIYRRKENSEHEITGSIPCCRIEVVDFFSEYGYRWEIESDYKSIKRFMAATTRRISCCDSSTSRSSVCCTRSGEWSICSASGVDCEHEHSPIVTADNTLTLMQKETGIG